MKTFDEWMREQKNKCQLRPTIEGMAKLAWEEALKLKHIEALKAINDEPEYPGEMSDDLWKTLKVAIINEDRALMVFVLRQSVREIKLGILERLANN